MTKYSWILPIKNEADSLPQLICEISKVMKSQSYEIIAIDDSSEDHTLSTLKILTKKYPKLKIVHLRLHQNKWSALSIGFRLAKGKIIITSDSDLQDDPKEIKKLLNKLNQGYYLVSGWRKNRYDPLYKVIISKIGNLLASRLTKFHFNDLNSPFKVYRKEVLESLPKQGSMLRFSIVFAKQAGYKTIEIPIAHRKRVYGNSKFGMVKYLRIIYDLILILMLFSGSGRLHKNNIKLN